ncbi:tRNA (adenine-N(1)-)-methyltransferase [Candidatus Desulforudis audaxviator MP104C]|uniref:tRNA (adenine(58)-N(1))-methyltransferase TrmI n=1 Tax=Desulforudis audaxviator (strain MP104C) TaxID=477974 RepID=B1I4R6_DESAP|nr:methyltransferase domain-containing protein [Candidatus Desulforudis audaxviator]ACA59987.1 tRNA (adenine-N(1)-)-methyltransferase [Candidatus Desulforudis audaxviator MP104C]
MEFREGELVIFLDHQERSFVQRLHPQGKLQTHRGFVPHADVIGCVPGTAFVTTKGKELFAFRPTLVDFTMNMPRKSGIIYPKDTAYILLWADVRPGGRVVAGGVGSGALLLALASQVGASGFVWGYDVRQDMLDFAAANLRQFLGDHPANTEFKLGNVYENIDERDVDSVILDVPEPWQAVEPSALALKPGGIIIAYMPTIRQAESFTGALRGSNRFGLVQTVEILVRDWHIRERSVRPNHRMVGHTGFLTVARRIVRPEGQAPPEDPPTEPESERGAPFPKETQD